MKRTSQKTLQNLAAQCPVIHNSTVVHSSQWLLPFCRHPSSAFCVVVEVFTRRSIEVLRLALPLALFLDTLLPRDKDGSECVVALGSGFCARFWVSCWKLHRSPCEHWPFSFHW